MVLLEKKLLTGIKRMRSRAVKMIIFWNVASVIGKVHILIVQCKLNTEIYF